MQSIDLIEKYVYGTSKDLIFKREKLNVIFQWINRKTFNLDCITNKDIKKKSKLVRIPEHPYQILINKCITKSNK